MKNTLLFIGLLLFGLNIKAQSYSVKLDTIYSFKHEKNISTPVALDSGFAYDNRVSINIGYKIVFDENRKIVETFEDGKLIEVSKIEEISYKGLDKYIYTTLYYNGVKCGGGFVFTKGRDGLEYLAGAYINPLDPNTVNGFYSKIKKGED